MLTKGQAEVAWGQQEALLEEGSWKYSGMCLMDEGGRAAGSGFQCSILSPGEGHQGGRWRWGAVGMWKGPGRLGLGVLTLQRGFQLFSDSYLCKPPSPPTFVLQCG